MRNKIRRSILQADVPLPSHELAARTRPEEPSNFLEEKLIMQVTGESRSNKSRTCAYRHQRLDQNATQ
jgi:hypothetical protein